MAAEGGRLKRAPTPSHAPSGPGLRSNACWSEALPCARVSWPGAGWLSWGVRAQGFTSLAAEGARAFLLPSLKRPRERDRRGDTGEHPAPLPFPSLPPARKPRGEIPQVPSPIDRSPTGALPARGSFPVPGGSPGLCGATRSSERSYRGGLEATGPGSRRAGRVADLWRAVPSRPLGELLPQELPPALRRRRRPTATNAAAKPKRSPYWEGSGTAV